MHIYERAVKAYCLTVGNLKKKNVKAHSMFNFFFLRQQAQQQRLEEDYTTVGETLDTARGFINETERTMADMNALVQVSLT